MTGIKIYTKRNHSESLIGCPPVTIDWDVKFPWTRTVEFFRRNSDNEDVRKNGKPHLFLSKQFKNITCIQKY
jgi:hypothetical protein